MTYKIMLNFVDLNVDNFLQLELTKLHVATDTLSVKPLCKVRTRSNYFACRVVDPWNNFDAKSDSFKLLIALKKFLGICDLSNFLIYK